MPICFRIPYTDIYGIHETVKWANTVKEARDLVKDSKGPTVTVGVPVPLDPQPFTEEYRAAREESARSPTSKQQT